MRIVCPMPLMDSFLKPFHKIDSYSFNISICKLFMQKRTKMRGSITATRLMARNSHRGWSHSNYYTASKVAHGV